MPSRSWPAPRRCRATACARRYATSGAVAPAPGAAATAWATCTSARPRWARPCRWKAGRKAPACCSTCRRGCRARGARLQLDQVPRERLEHRFAAAVHLELAVDALDVVRHGLARDPQAVGDLVVGQALGDAPQDVDLAPGQPELRVALLHARGVRLQAAQAVARDRGRQRRL